MKAAFTIKLKCVSLQDSSARPERGGSSRDRGSGLSNPSSSDAARFFDKMSGCETEWEKFFEDDYANRISAIHPDNRFGAEAVPVLMADDFFDLYDAIIPLFQFFISDLPHTR